MLSAIASFFFLSATSLHISFSVLESVHFHLASRNFASITGVSRLMDDTHNSYIPKTKPDLVMDDSFALTPPKTKSA
jgi:hypothetical protein